MHEMIKKLYSLHKTSIEQFNKELDKGIIKINFGFDKINGFFLLVRDEILENK